MADYGWRIPFAVGCVMIPFVFTMRRSLAETDDFAKRSAPPSMCRIIASIVKDGRVVLAGTCIIVMATVTFYLVMIYTPSFGRTVLKLEPTQTFIATCCVAIASFIITPIMAALSDHFGRRPLMLGVAALTLITVWPAMAWLVAEPSFSRLVAVQLWLAFLYSAYVGPVTVAIAEVMSKETRTIGFALTYSLAVSTGGFAPAIATYLIERFHSQAAPAAYAMAAAAIGIIGVVALPRKRTTEGGQPA
jgi:MFS family permease